MGSSQSSALPESSSKNQFTVNDDSSRNTTNTDTQQRPKNKKPPKDLTGPELVEYKCRKKKKAWSTCVGSFYGRFSNGKVLEDEEADCDELFDAYRQCYLRGMLKEREKKGLESPKEGTILSEFVEDEGLENQGK
jgi:hypothetical protein